MWGVVLARDYIHRPPRTHTSTKPTQHTHLMLLYLLLKYTASSSRGVDSSTASCQHSPTQIPWQPTEQSQQTDHYSGLEGPNYLQPTSTMVNLRSTIHKVLPKEGLRILLGQCALRWSLESNAHWPQQHSNNPSARNTGLCYLLRNYVQLIASASIVVLKAMHTDHGSIPMLPLQKSQSFAIYEYVQSMTPAQAWVLKAMWLDSSQTFNKSWSQTAPSDWKCFKT